MLASLREVCEAAKKVNAAAGSFNTPNLECLLAVLSAAEKLNVPVICAHAQLHETVAPLDKIGPVMLELAKRSKVPVCVHLDHGEDIEYCKRAVDLGFTSVMIDYSARSYEENVSGTREAAEYAHARGADVEAELGRLPNREGEDGAGDYRQKRESLYTDPALVTDFLQKTGADALAIAFGTAHGIYKKTPVLNMDIISRVRERTDIPLVMHGGSGISPEQYREVIRRGINKINYYTYMSYAGYAAAKARAEQQSGGFFHDLAFSAQSAMEENALATLRVFGGIR